MLNSTLSPSHSLCFSFSLGYVCSYVCYNFDIPFAFGLALFSCARVEINDAPFQKVFITDY